jgi:hypothetical protein
VVWTVVCQNKVSANLALCSNSGLKLLVGFGRGKMKDGKIPNCRHYIHDLKRLFACAPFIIRIDYSNFAAADSTILGDSTENGISATEIL